MFNFDTKIECEIYLSVLVKEDENLSNSQFWLILLQSKRF